MKRYIIFSVVCMQLGWTYAGRGVATYAYQDSSGNRYGGTYDLDGAQVYPSLSQPNGGKNWDNFAHGQVYTSDDQPEGAWPNFAPYEPSFQQYDDFFPEYFNNLQNLLNDVTGRRIYTTRLGLERSAPLQSFKPLASLQSLPSALHSLPSLRSLSRVKRFLQPLPPLPPLQPLFPHLRPLFPRLKPFKSIFDDNDPFRAFNTNEENQRLAYNAAKKAFDLTSNQAGYNPYFPTRFNNFDFDRFPMMNMPNSAYAGAAIRPGFSHQIAALNPENPMNPNIDIKNRFSDTASTGSGPGYYGVSSTSFSSSSSVNGQTVNHKGAETVVNNNGVVSRHRVES